MGRGRGHVFYSDGSVPKGAVKDPPFKLKVDRDYGDLKYVVERAGGAAGK